MNAVENIRSALEKWRKAKTMQEACEADDEYGDATDQDVMADAPYPGMIEAFEAHYGQSFTDKDWSNEASTWAAAWGYATRQASSEDLQSQQDKEIGKKWREDSRLEEWFPLTHEEHLRLQVEVANLREQLAQRGEPAFWLNEEGQLSVTRGWAERNAPGSKLIPLYTHPQTPQVQMTEDEIWRSDAIMEVNADAQLPIELIVEFVRAVEAHHGIKEQPGQHPDDQAVDRFAVAMKAKLAVARAKGRGGWDDPAQCTVDHLSNLLHSHVAKGDPVDVANFAMMLHQRGSGIKEQS